ncbi:sulfite exporter TauE/SafE family protein [Ectothiorhodospira lacustris]|uniref:sulfite exporter TauE/SafE family protein n=1 Tax=Ectothiorhodospira lacustris TaxID=2899127 RepID=UPI001EE91643|nr:sulfite exporter TauE/SafE family protein [Ectothiorhodospira lacustris]MCG5500278.1 sulfite exporter TauE/SafE family protein [Ectothiorhodospira lacustris]
MELINGLSPALLAGLIIALLATGVFAGILAGLLGVGGGIVIVPVLFHLFTFLDVDESVRMHLAVGTSLATIIPTSLRSARAHYHKGSLRPELFRALLPGVLLGVVLGVLLSGMFHGRVLTGIFALVALLVAINMAFKPRFNLGAGLPGRIGTTALGGMIGGFSTLMGIGGGTLSVPLLHALKVPMHQAVGTGAAIGIVISIPGAIGFIINGWGAPELLPLSLGYVNLLGLAIIVPATLLATPWGVNLAHAVDADRLRQLFALFLILTSLRMFLGLIS